LWGRARKGRGCSVLRTPSGLQAAHAKIADTMQYLRLGSRFFYQTVLQNIVFDKLYKWSSSEYR
jgi:hypothetical protein